MRNKAGPKYLHVSSPSTNKFRQRECRGGCAKIEKHRDGIDTN